MKAKKIFTAGKKMRFLVLILLALVLIAAAPLLLYATLFRWDAPLERRTLAPLNEAAIEVLSQEFQVTLKDEDTATVTPGSVFREQVLLWLWQQNLNHHHRGNVHGLRF